MHDLHANEKRIQIIKDDLFSYKAVSVELNLMGEQGKEIQQGKKKGVAFKHSF